MRLPHSEHTLKIVKHARPTFVVSASFKDTFEANSSYIFNLCVLVYSKKNHAKHQITTRNTWKTNQRNKIPWVRPFNQQHKTHQKYLIFLYHLKHKGVPKQTTHHKQCIEHQQRLFGNSRKICKIRYEKHKKRLWLVLFWVGIPRSINDVVFDFVFFTLWDWIYVFEITQSMFWGFWFWRHFLRSWNFENVFSYILFNLRFCFLCLLRMVWWVDFVLLKLWLYCVFFCKNLGF